MALDGFSVAGESTGAPATPGSSSASSALTGFAVGGNAPSALKGFTSIANTPGGQVPTDLPMPKMADTSKSYDDFLHYNGLSYQTPDLSGNSLNLEEKPEMTKNPIVDKITGGTTLGQFGKDFLRGLPAASAKVSGFLNDAIIKQPSDLISNSIPLQKWTNDADTNQGKAAAIGLIKGLSDMSALQYMQGATGGAYEAPGTNSDIVPKDNIFDSILKSGAQLVGAVDSIGFIGKGLTPAAAATALSENVGKLPLVGKYLAPFMKPLLETGVGLSVQSQFDPKLADNMKERAITFGKNMAETPFYTALGGIKQAWASVPTSFILGFGMAKLSGADNKTAFSNAALFAMMDGYARGTGERPVMSEEEMQQHLQTEARKTLENFSGHKITDALTPAELKSIYYVAAHRSHPDVGGTNEAFIAVKNAYDLLSKGKGDAAPEAEESIKMLSNGTKDGIAKDGELVTHQALKDKLGVDDTQAAILLGAAKTPKTEAEIQETHQKIVDSIQANRSDEEIKADAVAHTAQNSDSLIKSYVQKHGNFVGADEAKEFMPGYSSDRTTSDLVQKGASQLGDKIYEHLLQKNENKGNNTVLISGGGTGSGKSTALKDSNINTKDYAVVFDSNSANFPASKARIDKALAKGYDVSFVHVHAPVDKAYDRVLDRAEQMTQRSGSGRPVSAQGHIDMHHGSADTFAKLVEEYKDNPRVHLGAIDNSAVHAKAVENHVDFIQKIVDNKKDENQLHADLNQQRAEALHDKRISEQTNAGFERAEKLRPQKDNGGNGKELEQGKESKDELTQKEKVIAAVEKEPLSIKEVAKLTKILEPNVRRILGVGTKDGTFKRVSEGVYVLKTKKGNFAYVEMGDAVETIARMAKEGQVFDSVILDPAYYSRALMGGNRGLKANKFGGWDQFITPDKFSELMDSVSKVMKHDDSHVYLMLAGAPTAQKDMDEYVKGATDAGFKVVGEGKYMKTTKAGKLHTNVQGKTAAGERLILMTQSGTARAGEIPKSLDFRFVRPSVAKSYQTEKAAELMKALIMQSTLKGETVLDPFAGSGVTGAEALKAGRNAVLVEKSQESVEKFTKPRVQAAADEINVGDTITLDGNDSTVTDILENKKPENVKYLIKNEETGREVWTNREGIRQGVEASKDLASQRGFVSPGQMAQDIKTAAGNVKDTIEHIEQARELTGDVRMSIYQHENARKAMRVRLTSMVEEVGKLLDAEGWEQLYHYDENKDENLSPSEKKVYDEFILPLKRALTDTISKYREAGGTITPDLFFMTEGEYTPRFAKDKQSALDKLLEKGKDKIKSIQNGGLLSKSMGTVDKSRKFYAATDEDGNRVVVYVPTDKSADVLAFRNGKIENLGPVKGMKSPKIPEFYDANTMRKLNDLAASLGITHKRVAMGQEDGLGRKNAGVSMTGRDTVKTRISPSWVLAHEIGHQIDDKYGMQKFMKDERYDPERKAQVIAEMRDLADKRYEGMEVPDSYKKYVRKGEEKMAVMFEAYILNRSMFKEVAPHLYDDFRDFLNEHDELRPFLDIQPQLTLGKTVHGGEQSGKIGTKFVDKNKREYDIGQATTKEIEDNTSVAYHKNVLANYVVAFDRANNALGAMKLLERLKNEEAFGEIIKKDSPDEAFPDGWKSVGDVLPQFRGYHMEPRTAEALEDLAGRQRGSSYIPVFDEINNFLTTAIVLNPIMHVPNVIAGRSLAASVGDVSAGSLKNFGKAYGEVTKKGPLYLKYLEHGAPFMALKDTTKSFADAIFTQYTSEVENNPTQWEEISKTLGYANPKALIDGFMHINESITWGSNDIFFMHALMDYNDAHGGTMEDAIKEVSKRMADYRIPERILLPGVAGRALSKGMQSRAFLFGRFHYTGVIKPWLELAREGATGSASQKITALRGLAYLLIMGLAVWPYINKMWQGVTGSPTTYESMPGPLRPIEVGQRLAEDGIPGIPRALQSIFTPSPAIKSAIELGFNVDLFNHNPIYGPLPAEGMTTYGTSLVSPMASASRMTPQDFALSLFGIWTPKNVPAKNTLQQMKYDELPALQTQVKKDITAGDTKKANDEMLEYNTRAVAAWNQYQLESEGKDFLTTDAQKQEFLKTWGIKTPGTKALANASALYGDGSLTSKSSLLSTVVTYAQAVGVDPQTAFERVFTGQKILRVTNFGLFNPDSAIIVERMPLSASEAVKSSRDAQPGQVLDHVVPLEAGGSNDLDNLNLIPAANNEGEQHVFENLLGASVRAGKITQAQVREYSIRYKVGQGETLPPGMMKEFTDKYGGKPMSLQDVQDAIGG